MLCALVIIGKKHGHTNIKQFPQEPRDEKKQSKQQQQQQKPKGVLKHTNNQKSLQSRMPNRISRHEENITQSMLQRPLSSSSSVSFNPKCCRVSNLHQKHYTSWLDVPAPTERNHFALPLPPPSGWLSSNLFRQSAKLSLSPRLALSSRLGAPCASKSNVLLRR